MRQVSRLSVQASLWAAAVILAAIGALHAVVLPLAPLKSLDLALDDLRQRTFASQSPHPDITIVDIDEASLRDIGRWPWGRDRLAELTTELFERQRIAALGFDFVFAEPDMAAWIALQRLARDEPPLAARLPAWRQALDHDQQFAKALQGRPVALGYYFTADRGGARNGQLPAPLFQTAPGAAPLRLPGWSGYGANLPLLAAAAPRAGFFNALPDEDGVVRAVPAVAQLDGRVYESLALALLRLATGTQRVEPVAVGGAREGGADLQGLLLSPGYAHPDAAATAPPAVSGAASAPPALPPVAGTGRARRLAVDERGALRVPYRGSGGPAGRSFRYISAGLLLAGAVPPGALAGQLVLVGSSAPGLSDLRATPVNASMPGVEVHAHLLAGLLDGRLPQRPAWAPGFEAVLILLTLGLTVLAGSRLSAPRAIAAVLGLFGLLLGANWAAFALGALVLPVASALALGGLLFIGALVANYLQEWQRRRSLMQLFSSYVPPDRARELARDPSQQQVAADNRELTLLFCDLRGFSGLAETLPPLALRDLLNQYLSTATEVVHRHGGTLDKFIGDAVMAFWGAPQPQPDHAVRAVQAALDLTRSLSPLNAALRARGLPAVSFGLGLATGVVCVGDLGSALRRSYTAVGDAVNLAARLEALTREVEVDLLVSDATRRACADHLPGVVWAEVDECLVRGRRQAVTIFTPLQADPAALPLLREQVSTWELALQASRQQHADETRAHLAQLDALITRDFPTASSAPVDHPTAGRTLQMLSDRLARQVRLGPSPMPSQALSTRPAAL